MHEVKCLEGFCVHAARVPEDHKSHRVVLLVRVRYHEFRHLFLCSCQGGILLPHRQAHSLAHNASSSAERERRRLQAVLLNRCVLRPRRNHDSLHVAVPV